MEQQDINPYAAPQATHVSTSLDPSFSAPDAGGGKRFLNYLIDRFAVMGCIFVLAAFVGVLEGIGIVHGAVDAMQNISGIVDFCFSYLATFLYYVLFEGLFGRTIGKLITGTKVVMTIEAPLTFRSVILRSLSRLVPFEPLSFLGGDASGWHDKWTHTRVVDLRAAPVPKPRPMSAGNMPRIHTPQMPRPSMPPSINPTFPPQPAPSEPSRSEGAVS